MPCEYSCTEYNPEIQLGEKATILKSLQWN